MAGVKTSTSITNGTQTVLLCAVGAPILYYTWKSIVGVWRWLRRRSALRKIPGPPTHFFWGNLHQHPGFNDGEALLNWWRSNAGKYGGVFLLWFGPTTPVVVVNNCRAVAAILRTDEPKSTEYGAPYRLILPWLGEGLLISTGDLWYRNRRLLTPAFHYDILKPYVNVYNEAVDVMMENWSRASKGGTPVEVFSSVSLCTLNIILRCAFSYDGDVQKHGDSHPYVVAIGAVSKMVSERLIRPWLYADWVYKLSSRGRKFYDVCRYIHQFSDDIIAKRKQTLKDSEEEPVRGRGYLDFLDILLSARDDDGRGLSDLEIRNEVNTFMFEGHDTTASAISWTLYALAENPDCQGRARREIDELLTGRDLPDIEWRDLTRLPYLTCCIKEAMRLHGPVPFVARYTTRDLDIDGYTVPAGTRISIAIYLLHHNPEIWGENHMEFDPERFRQDRQRQIDPYAYVPFSAGPRNCIGQNFALNEEKVIIARVLQRYIIELVPGRTPTHLQEAVMRAPNGIYLRLKRREDKE